MPIYHGAEDIELPEQDLITYLFGDSTRILHSGLYLLATDSNFTECPENAVIHMEASNPSIHYTKATARGLLRRFAHTLRSKFGIGSKGPGKDVVVTISSGQCYLPIAFYGVIAAGGVYSAASSAFAPTELARQVKDGDSNLIICSRDVLKVAQEAGRLSGVSPDRILVLESNPAFKLSRAADSDALDLLGVEQLDWERVTDKKVLQERPITLLYSSGTTGVPKGALLSNWNMVSESAIPVVLLRRHQKQRSEEGRSRFEYNTLAHLPAAHVAGVQGYFVNPFASGGRCVWMQKFDFEKFLLYIKQHRITFLFTVPPICLLIAKSPLVSDQLSSLEFCIVGAAPMGPELQRQASEKMSVGTDVWITQTWGLSETCGSFTVMPFGARDYSGSVSRLMYNTLLRLVDDDGNDVKEGMRGEVIVKGPMVFIGYHNKPDANKESFRDGWFCTGDIGVMQGDLLYIVDRKKELIKYKGLQVAPAELEALLLSHPKIADAAVIGVPWEGTEAPRAYVVADKSKVSEDQIKGFVKSNASSHKQLRGGVIFVDAIPKSPSGKILRKDLREKAKKEIQSKL